MIALVGRGAILARLPGVRDAWSAAARRDRTRLDMSASPTAPASVPGSPLLVRSAWAARALAVATGLLYFLAFPGLDAWPLGFVTWVPLLAAMRGRSVMAQTRLAWLSGFTMTFVGFYWMLGMLETFSGFPTAVCAAIMALLALYQGGRMGLFGYLYARAASLGWWRGPCFALAFVASELAYPLLFPWYFGAVVHQLPALTQLAELGSPIAVGLVLVLFNYALAELLFAWHERRPLPWRMATMQALALGLSAAYGAVRLGEIDRQTVLAPKGRVGIVQANMGLMEKRRDRDEGLRRHLQLSRALLAEGPIDLIVWSETSVTGGVYEDEAAAVYRQLFTEELRVPVLFGALLVRDVSDARQRTLFNSALMSDGNGHITGRYDKHALLAFGEYLPLGDTFPVLYDWSPNTGAFTPGNQLAALPLGPHKLSAHICYEDVLPSFVNDLIRASDADLLVNITNDAWYGDSTQPWIHLALATFRAIEHRRFFVRSTNSGVSAFIDAGGRVLAHTQSFEQAALSHEVAFLKLGSTPYELYGDAPWWACTAIIAGLCIRPRRPRAPRDAAASPAAPP
jgi:apolipoprotein N-acyltransferase